MNVLLVSPVRIRILARIKYFLDIANHGILWGHFHHLAHLVRAMVNIPGV